MDSKLTKAPLEDGSPSDQPVPPDQQLRYRRYGEWLKDGELLVQLVGGNARVPFKHYDSDAGYDMTSVNTVTIEPHGKALVSTGLKLAIPRGWYGRVAPRSSLGWKHHISIGAGVIDSHYRGIVKVVMYNHSDIPHVIEPGDRIAQLIITRCMNASVTVVDQLDETDRSSGGFGSTGV